MFTLTLDLQNFREALAVLQRQVDDLDELKAAHYQEIVDHEEEVWNVVQAKVCRMLPLTVHSFTILLCVKVCVVVRSEMDVFDRITSKSYV